MSRESSANTSRASSVYSGNDESRPDSSSREDQSTTESFIEEDDDSSEYSSMYSSIMSSYKAISDKRSSRSSSVSSISLTSELDYDLKTFLTEAKIGTKPGNKKAWAAKRGVKDTASEISSRSETAMHIDPSKLSSYKRGDFVERNRVLGKEARYYHALTEEETYRIKTILDIPDSVSYII
jgi:hypothetical protein